MELLLLEEIDKELTSINLITLTGSLLIMIKQFILPIGEIIGLFNGTLMQVKFKSWQVEMEKEIELIS